MAGTSPDFPDFDFRSYDRLGQPISFMRGLELRQDLDYVRVARDTFGPAVVSTDWLCEDAYCGKGPIIAIFETAVFPDGAEHGKTMRVFGRYFTEEEARAGHAEACALAQAQYGPEAGR